MTNVIILLLSILCFICFMSVALLCISNTADEILKILKGKL